ncbi:MAG: aldo/keto reductase [Armatimonadetes bacterium]|nr:aldo/keto reductase [Armatimonadota bacterium]
MTIPTVKLNSGYEIPVLGLGTWELTGDACVKAVPIALRLGYNHIDTAFWYGNHTQIGEGLSQVPHDRSQLFITSKIPPINLQPDEVLKIGRQCVEELGVGYLDLLLIHWPNRNVPMADTFGAMKQLLDEGVTRSIGVSNFTIAHVQKALEVSELPIAVNQVEFHPLLNQTELLNFCQEQGIVVEAYSPLCRGEILRHPTVRAIGEKYGKSAAQVSLRWLLQKGCVVIPKASSEPHLQDNLGALGWELAEEDMAALEQLDEGKRMVDPDFAEWDIKPDEIL